MTAKSKSTSLAHTTISPTSRWRSSACLAGAIIALAAGATAEATAQQATRKIVADVIGCKDKAVRERLTKLRLSGDKEAFERLGKVALTTGACRELTIGMAVYLEVGSMFDYVCLRPVGETQCYWTFAEGIK